MAHALKTLQETAATKHTLLTLLTLLAGPSQCSTARSPLTRTSAVRMLCIAFFSLGTLGSVLGCLGYRGPREASRRHTKYNETMASCRSHRRATSSGSVIRHHLSVGLGNVCIFYAAPSHLRRPEPPSLSKASRGAAAAAIPLHEDSRTENGLKMGTLWDACLSGRFCPHCSRCEGHGRRSLRSEDSLACLGPSRAAPILPSLCRVKFCLPRAQTLSVCMCVRVCSPLCF